MAKPADEIDWQAPNVIQTANGLKGVVAASTGIEEKPCFTCAKWIKDAQKLIQHFHAKGLKADTRGVFTTPIVQDFGDGRRSMEIDPKDWGYCPAECMPTHMLATCERWRPVTLSRELAGKIRR